MIITIDGPTASGKTTVARALAKRLGYYYVYSGLLYRTLAYLLVEHGAYRQEQLSQVTASDIANYLDEARLIYRYDDQFQERVFFDGQDITPHMHSSVVDENASIVSINVAVRQAINSMQHAIAREYDIVVDGRDTGSIVFPSAPVKFFLTASDAIRAERWRLQQKSLGYKFSEQEAYEFVAKRDTRDKERTIAPLIVPDDAIIIDNSDINSDETLEKILDFMYANRHITPGQ